MIFVNKRSEKWCDEFKMAIFRYFKYLPSDCDNYTKIIQNLNDCLFIQMPTHDNIQEYIGTNMHHEKAIIKPEIEFFYQLCNGTANKNTKLPETRKVILLATEEFKHILPELNSIPPCFTKIPFLMRSLINEKIVSDEHDCNRCDWGRKLITYRNILYHINQIKEVWINEKSINIGDGQTIDIINDYQKKDFISDLYKIKSLLNSFSLISNKEKLNNLKVYILEDNKTDCKFIKDLLKDQGIKEDNIKLFNDPRGFIDSICQTDPQIEIKKDAIVLLDLMMLNHDKQGEDICKNINYFNPFLPIIILSGKKDIFSTVNKLVGLNYYAFFSKDNLIGTDKDKDEDIKNVYTRIFILKMLESIEDAEHKSVESNYIVESIRGVNKNIGIVVAGFGDFSRNTFGNLLQLIEKMNKEYREKSRGTKFELLAIIDPDYSTRRVAKERLKKENLSHIPVVRRLIDASQEIAGYKGKIIIRDVSSSDKHSEYHKDCQDCLIKNEYKLEFCHFVEKPIALSLDDLKTYKETNRFSTVLEEIENPAVLTVKEYIQENKLSIKKLKFWRYSSMAWIQLLKKHRIGVRGGSYMDKSIHDWAVAYYLLNISDELVNLNKDIEANNKTKIEMFMPYSCNNLLEPYPRIEFYGHCGKVEDKKTTKELVHAEDLKMHSEVILMVDNNRPVEIIMNSSWGGITRKDREEILKPQKNFFLEGALFEKEQFGVVDFEYRRQIEYKFNDQELRLGEISCEKEAGEKVYIYFNMLTKDEAGINPFVKVIRNGRLDNIPLCQRKETHLDRILEDGFLYLSGNKKTSKTGPKMSIFCHTMALKCLDKAREYISQTKEIAKKDILEHIKEVEVKFYWQ